MSSGEDKNQQKSWPDSEYSMAKWEFIAKE